MSRRTPNTNLQDVTTVLLEIEWSDHPVLHNLKLDFRKHSKSPCQTIVIAGENGTGKTSILTSINNLMTGMPTPTLHHVTYERNGCQYSARPDTDKPGFGFYHRENLETNQIDYFRIDKLHLNPGMDADEAELRHYGCIYLSARSGFKTSPITSSTTKQLDTEKSGEDRDFDYTEIKQLMVDLDEQDAQEFRRNITESANQCDSVPKDWITKVETNSKMFRFTNAFDEFFDSKLRFKDIDRNNPNEKVIRFAKGNEEISIDDLSTGEKQIVFRGAYCLRNNRKLKNGLVLIDEPELSMHPKWQRKILRYYKDLFTYDGEQTAQMIVATHSDHVVSEALSHRDDVKVIVLKEEENGIVAHEIDECVLPRVQSSEVNYIAFGIPTLDYFLALYNRVQDMAKDSGYGNSIADCDRFIVNCSTYDSSMAKNDNFKNTPYYTLPTYVRNAISHPNSERIINEADIERCIEFMRRLCKQHIDEPHSESHAAAPEMTDEEIQDLESIE